MIDLIVMRQNKTADETLIQIGKGIPRQSPNEKPVLLWIESELEASI